MLELKQVRAQEPSTATQLNKQLSRVNAADAEAPRLCILHPSHMLLLCTSGNTTEQFVPDGGLMEVSYLDAHWQDLSSAEAAE